MIGVVVGVDDGVELADAGGEELLAQVRRGVDEDTAAVVLDQDGGAQAPVSRVVGIAGAPVVADERHAARAAAAEDGDAHPRLTPPRPRPAAPG